MALNPYDDGRMESLLNLAARDRAIPLLCGQGASWINFAYRDTVITKADFVAVANALSQNRIYMDVDLGRPYNGAYWPAKTKINGHSVSGKFRLGFDTALLYRTQSKALLIHESVHAALDLRNGAAISILRSECVAYIAQQLWYRAVTGDWIPDKGKKFKYAAVCGEYAWNAKVPLLADALLLEAAILSDPEYGLKALETAAYDG